MEGKTENGRWQIGFWVMTVLVVSSFSWSTVCYLNNQRRIEINTNKLYGLQRVSNDALHQIDLRLSRIEFSLGIDTFKEKGVK